MPAVIAGLIAAVAAASIACAIGDRNGAGQLLFTTLLSALGVWHGQLWRLVSFSLVEVTPWGLIMSCLMLYWFGGDLVRSWGGARFLAIYFGLGAAAGAVTCLLALVWPALHDRVFAGVSVVLDGMVVAWGLLFAGREIRLFGLARIKGRSMVPIAIGGTLLFALFYGFAGFVPHFAAELLVLLWLGLWRPWRSGRRGERVAAAARGEAWSFDRWYEREKRR